MLKSTYSLPGLILGFFITAVVMIQPSNAEGLSTKDIRVITQKITVRIDGRDDQHSGSGILLQHNGNDYLVLTNWHVVNAASSYTIYTYDGLQYTIESSDIRHLPKVDLAVLTLKSSTNYQTASIGDASQLEPGTKLWIGGFPLRGPVNKERAYLFLSGDISGRLTKPENGGYELICTASAIQGMSGGPILNEEGQVVGVNGLSVKDNITGNIPNLVYGIPINTYEDVLAQQNPPQAAGDLDNLGFDKYNKGDYQGAIATFTKVIHIDPNNSYAYKLRGNAHYSTGDYQGAIADYNMAIQLKPNFADAYNNRGNAHYSTGDYQGAIADYNMAIQLKPNFADAYNNRGVTRNSTGDYQGAIADYNMAIKLNPNDALAYNNRGVTRNSTGDYQGAIADYNMAIQLKPNFAEAYYNRGPAHDSTGDYQGAIADYNMAIQLKPNYADAYNNRGILRRQLGDKQGAQQDLDKAKEIGK